MNEKANTSTDSGTGEVRSDGKSPSSKGPDTILLCHKEAEQRKQAGIASKDIARALQEFTFQVALRSYIEAGGDPIEGERIAYVIHSTLG